ncbi:MAG: DUF1848 domain-containing protein [Firmicutes bacterium]|nr:DUF1848 domain-containing protein [Bacillota bacterium]
MIISASRRTDLPCCYAGWFMNRIRAGYVLTRNPMNRAQIFRVPLTPDVVDCIVFWTKDAANLMPYLDELDALGYRYYFQFTLTPYGSDLEQNLRPKAEIEECFRALSKRIGRERVVWRYDPIILNDRLTPEYHRAEFRRLCGSLSGFTDTVVISFVDVYAKLKRQAGRGGPVIRPASGGETAELAGYIGKTTAEYGLRAAACCEAGDLARFGIGHSSCIDRERIERICGCAVDLRPDKNQRKGCGCAESVDIGAYNTCRNGCVYCYATDSRSVARCSSVPDCCESELLAGTVAAGEKITDKKVKSNRQEQITLF